MEQHILCPVSPTDGVLGFETSVCYAGVGTKAEQHGSSCGTLSGRLSGATQAGNDSGIYGRAIMQLQVVVDTAGPDTHAWYKQVITLPNTVLELML